MQPATLELESTLTDRYQTTVPETVRRTLHLGKRDKIHYSIQPDGRVLLSRVTPMEDSDPLLGDFLSFLAHDMALHPEQIQALDGDLAQRILALTGPVAVDLDRALSADDE